jgi:hypothetical protein
MVRNKFSKRLGYGLVEKEITIREDAPIGLRDFIIQLMYDFYYTPAHLKVIICSALRIACYTSPHDEDEYISGVGNEVNRIIRNCKWYQVYDIIEKFWHLIKPENEIEFENEINDYFVSNGIGWKLENGLIKMRGDEYFENAIERIGAVLNSEKFQTAKTEIKEALHDLSRRPEPDITGAIQHSMACMECICREITGDKKSTLGQLLKKNITTIPKPLDSAVEKIWGYTSEQGRHLEEGKVPDYIEAELIVQLTAAISIYLTKKA